MAVVTPIPFVIALLVGLLLFVALTCYLVRESQRPIEWSHVDARIAAEQRPHVSHTRMAAVCFVFTVWSLWVTARPVSGWR